MGNEFNYEDVFMGVIGEKKKSYLRTFVEDYRLKRLIEAVKQEKMKLLDIGCGGGILTESLPYYFPKAKVYGCDVSQKAIEYAKKFGSGKVTYTTIKGKKLPYKTSSFDLCICLDVMEHIPDVAYFLQEVKRILKRNGKFFVLVPTEGQPFTHTWLWQKIGLGRTMTFRRYGHIHPEFTHAYILNLLKKNGFQVMRKTYSEHLLYQLITIFTYFLPLEVMDALLGKKAVKYSDRGVLKVSLSKKKKFDPIMFWRFTWMNFTNAVRYITLWELDLLKNFSPTAWKIHVLAKVKK